MPPDRDTEALMTAEQGPPAHDDGAIVVIGGGIAGLSVALHLAERGLNPVVLEADASSVGGRLSGGETFEVNGYDFCLEHGVHGIWSPYRNLQAMLSRHELRPVFVPAQEENWIFRYGGALGIAPVGSAIRRSLFPPPFHYLQLFFRPRFLLMLDIRDWLALFNVWGGLILGVGVDPYMEDQPLHGMSLADITRCWPPALKGFFLGLARNGLSAQPEEVSLSGFIGFLRFYTLLRRDAWVFSYLPEEGGTSVSEPLAERVCQLGGEIRQGCAARQLIRDGSSIQVVYESPGGPGVERAKQVVVATDVRQAEKIFKASYPAEAGDLFYPRALSNVIVRFWFDTAMIRDAEAGIFSGDFTLHNYFWLDRIYNSYRRWARKQGGSALEAHIYGPEEILAEPDALLLARAQVDVFQAWPGLRGHLVAQHIQRNPDTHTLPVVGDSARHLGIRTPWEGVFCAGDWVRHRTPAFFLERACVTGIAAANQVLAERGLKTWPMLDYLPPEPFVGWIEKLMRQGRARRRERIKKQPSE